MILSPRMDYPHADNVANLLGGGFVVPYLRVDCARVVLVESLECAPAVPQVRGFHEHGQGAVVLPVHVQSSNKGAMAP